jgi:hypothetical protein
MSNNNPSLFSCTSTRSDEFVEEFTVDLSKVALISKSTYGYHVHLIGTHVHVSPGIGAQLLPAWQAFQGKFIPGQTN